MGGEVKNEEITNCTLRANARRDGEKRENWRMGERHHQKYTAQNENNNKNKHKQYVYVKFSYSYREFSLSLRGCLVLHDQRDLERGLRRRTRSTRPNAFRGGN